MAGLMDAIIVPFSAVGISDSVNIILDQEGIAKLNIYIFISCSSTTSSPRDTKNAATPLSIILITLITTFSLSDLEKIPFIRDRTKDSGMASARAGVVENLLPPLFLPKAPERNYFLFGQVRAFLHFSFMSSYNLLLHFDVMSSQLSTVLSYTIVNYSLIILYGCSPLTREI